jgi:hypothetical protein
MAVSKGDYNESQVTAARAVMVELGHLLGEFREDVVIIGGWVPALLFEQSRDPAYETIRRLLTRRGYREGKQPFMFSRTVRLEDRDIEVEVHLAAGEYEGTGKPHRTQVVQDVRARKARGCDLAFRLFREITIQGILPDGGRDTAVVRVAGVVPFIVMKGMALHDRMKEKDAWDIYYCLRNYPSGLEGLVGEFRPHRTHGLVKEGLSKIADKFQSAEHIGPRFVADFAEVSDPEERAVVRRDA